jgi:glucosylglycerol 3-phosphatase
MEALLLERLPALLPEVDPTQLAQLAHQAVLDTEVSPTVNLNGLFGLIPNDLERQRQLQGLLEALMEKLLQEATQQGLDGSFFLHAAPNLGWDATGRERMKPSVAGDVGTTDIQFMLTGSLKEAGLLVLINRHIATRWGEPPLGEDFNVRTAPRTHQALMDLARAKIPPDKIPRLVGVGDTVTSTPAPDGQGWLRGGSDRGFLTLLKDLGQWCGQSNRVILVDSSHGEVDRPGLADETLAGISDPEDPLHLDVLMPSGPEGYIQWFIHLSERRSQRAAD